jgi:hypothetical protein
VACTTNLQATVIWTSPHVRYQPLQLGGNEPALTYGNLILQTVCGPPFKWPWNRGTATFSCTPQIQDYTQYLKTFGYLTSGSLIDLTSKKPKELTIRASLELDGQQERPAYVSHEIDDGADNMTFRVSPSPDQGYPVTLTYQNKPALMTSLASLWAPIPDELAYVVNYGYLALALLMTNDERFQVFNQRFMAHLLGRAGGLSEMERNIFVGNWMTLTGMMQGSQLTTQQAIASRQT